jgi:thioredoxin-related protein
MSENVREIQAAQYEAEVLAAPEPVVLDFFSTECPPCEALAAKLAVTSSPTLLFYKGGKEVGSRLTGDIKRSEIKQTVEAMLA